MKAEMQEWPLRRLLRFWLALRLSRRPFPRWLIRGVAGRENLP